MVGASEDSSTRRVKGAHRTLTIKVAICYLNRALNTHTQEDKMDTIIGLVILLFKISIIALVNAFIFDSFHFLDSIFGLNLTLIQTWKLFFMFGTLMFQVNIWSIYLAIPDINIKGKYHVKIKKENSDCCNNNR